MHTIMPRPGDCVETGRLAATGWLFCTATVPPVTMLTFTVDAAVPALPVTVTSAGNVAPDGLAPVYGPLKFTGLAPSLPLTAVR